MYKFSQNLNNYELFQILPFGEKLIKVDPRRPEANIFHLSNFVYIRKDISRKILMKHKNQLVFFYPSIEIE